jgi:hypothetical protein
VRVKPRTATPRIIGPHRYLHVTAKKVSKNRTG